MLMHARNLLKILRNTGAQKMNPDKEMKLFINVQSFFAGTLKGNHFF